MFTKKTNNLFLFLFVSLFAIKANAQEATKMVLAEEIQQAHASGLEFREFKLFSITAGEKHDILDDETLLLPDANNILHLYETKPRAISLVMEAVNGKKYRLDMLRSNPFSENANLSYIDANGTHPFAGDRGVHYQGAVAGSGQSLAALSVFANGEVMALFADETGNFVVGKLEDNSGRYIFYNDGDFNVIPPTSCGTNEIPVAAPDEEEPGSGDKTTASFDCKKVRLYWEADYELYSNKQSSATLTQSYMTGLFNQVQTMYRNEKIAVELKSLHVWTIPDGYSGSSSHDGLSDFTSAWNAKGDNFDGDIAMLLARDNGGNGGVAFLNVLCNKSMAYAYGDVNGSYQSVPTYSWDVMMVTHEIGHNLGSNHTHWCGWNTGGGGSCGSIDDCVTQQWGNGCSTCPSTYSNSSPGWKGTVMSYCHLTSRGVSLASGFGPLPGNRIRTEVGSSACLKSIISATLVTTPVCRDKGSVTLVFDSVAVGTNHFGANPHVFTWSNGNNTQNISVSQPGSYSVTVTDSNGCKAVIQATVTQNNADSCKSTSVANTTTDREYLGLYPNPAHNSVTVKFFSAATNVVVVKLSDVTGKIILTQEVKALSGENNISLNLSGLTPGMYFVNLSSSDTQYKGQKLVIQ